VDTLAPSTKKNAANCDKSCELQNLVNHLDFERKLRPGVKLGRVCSSVINI